MATEFQGASALVSEFIIIWSCYWAGLKAALPFQKIYRVCSHSRTIRATLTKCFVLNGVLFVGSLIVFHYMITPLLRYLLHLDAEVDDWDIAEDLSALGQRLLPSGDEIEASSATASAAAAVATNAAVSLVGLEGTTSSSGSAYANLITTILELLCSIFELFYYVFWLLPVYFFSLILSNEWYSELASTTHQMTRRKPASGTAATYESPSVQRRNQERSKMHNGASRIDRSLIGRVADGVADLFYRLPLSFAFIIQSVVLRTFVPAIGEVLYFVNVCWLYSLYCFEYPWLLRGLYLHNRICKCQRNWAFLLGFGTPFAILCVYFPYFLSTGIFSLVFPFFIMAAIMAKIRYPRGRLEIFPEEIGMFYYPMKLVSACIRLTKAYGFHILLST